MKLFAIGDLHLSFYHPKPMDLFGDNWKNHTATLQKYWKQIIANEDIVCITGDISWAMRLQEVEPDLKFLQTLPGTKICIRGNHDYWWDRPSKINGSYDKMYFLQNEAYKIGDTAICGTRGWLWDEKEMTQQDKKIYNRECIRLQLSLEDAMKKNAKQIIVMLHYPPAVQSTSTNAILKMLQNYPVTKVVYGHLHDKQSWANALQGKYNGAEYYLVSADYLQFQPLYITEFAK